MVECGNRLRVGVLVLQTLACRGWFTCRPFIEDRDKGGVRTYRTPGGGTRPESRPSKTWTVDPRKLTIFYRISVERGLNFRGLWKFKIFTLNPLIFRDLTPHLSRSPIYIEIEQREAEAINFHSSSWQWTSCLEVTSGRSWLAWLQGTCGTSARTTIAIPRYRSLHPPEPRNPQKSQKGLPRPPRPECQNSVEKVPEHWFCSLFDSLTRRPSNFRKE